MYFLNDTKNSYKSDKNDKRYMIVILKSLLA